jgi:hypothetical protein
VPAYELRPASSHKPENEPFYVDYAKVVDVALALVRPAFAEKRAVFFFLFGYPGTGKSCAEQPVWWRLNAEGMPYSLLRINSLSIATRQPASARRYLDEIADEVNRPSNYPLFIFLDEADALAPDRQLHPSEITVCHWTMNLVKELRQTKMPSVVVACTNYPDDCDEVVLSEIGPSIYIPETPKSALETACCQRGVPDYQAVVAEYWNLCLEQERVPFMRPLLDAHQNVAGRWTDSTTAKDRAQSLFDYNAAPPRAKVEEYEHGNKHRSERIERAKRLKDFLVGRVGKTQQGGRKSRRRS